MRTSGHASSVTTRSIKGVFASSASIFIFLDSSYRLGRVQGLQAARAPIESGRRKLRISSTRSPKDAGTAGTAAVMVVTPGHNSS